MAGKFGIGARVREGDDEGTITGKRKGWRQVKFDCQKDDGEGGWWAKSDLTPVGLTLEYGKFYVDRDGEERGPLVKNENGLYTESHPFSDGDITWRPDGGFLVEGDGKDGWDIVAEVVAPPAEEKPEEDVWVPKVGDRVRITDVPEYWWFKRGDIGEIVEEPVIGRFQYAVRIDGDSLDNPAYVNDAHIELAPLTLEAGKFYRTRDGQKVGPAQLDGKFNIGTDEYGRNAFAYIRTMGDYTADGVWLTGNEGGSPQDLVAEWVEPVAVTVGEPLVAESGWTISDAKPGDVVRCDEWDGIFYTTGSTYTVDADGSIPSDGGCPYTVTLGKWSLVRSAPKFKVGDRVRITDPWPFRTGTKVGDVAYLTSVPTGDSGFYELDLHHADGVTRQVSSTIRFELDTDLPIGTPVTLTGVVTGINNGNRSVTLDALPLRVSFDFPATSLCAA